MAGSETTDESGGDALHGSDRVVPRVVPAWFASFLFCSIVAVAATGTSGIVLLRLGWYHPIAPVVLAAISVVGAWRWRPRRAPHSADSHVDAAHAMAVAVFVVLVSAAFHSEHLLTERDPGVYVNTARSIARTHEVTPLLDDGPFADRERYDRDSAGFAVRDDELRPNFMHFLPVLLAAGRTVGGDAGLLAVPAVLGGVGVLAIYALATLLAGPRSALVAPAVLAATPLQWWHARDAYSELPVQILLVGGLWAWLAGRDDARPATGAVAGAAVGCAALARVDALAAMFALPIAAAAVWALDSGSPRRQRTSAAFTISLGVMFAIALDVNRNLSGGYVSALGEEYRPLQIALGGALLVTVPLARWLSRGGLAVVTRITRSSNATLGAGIAIAAIAAWAWFVRPQPRSELRVRAPSEPITLELRRAINDWHWSHSLRWFGWYLGALAVVIAVVGWIVIVRRVMRADVAPLVLTSAALPVTVLYLWRPRIAPDHLWAMRRFLPIVIPAAMIAITVAVAWIARRRPLGPLGNGRFVALVLVAIVTATAARSGVPLLDARLQHGALAAVDQVCSATGDDAAILVVPYASLGMILPQTLRGFCGVPVAKPRAPEAVDVYELARAWQEQGRRLFIIGASTDAVLSVAPDASPVVTVVVDDRYAPEKTRDGAPRERSPQPVEVHVYTVRG